MRRKKRRRKKRTGEANLSHPFPVVLITIHWHRSIFILQLVCHPSVFYTINMQLVARIQPLRRMNHWIFRVEKLNRITMRSAGMPKWSCTECRPERWAHCTLNSVHVVSHASYIPFWACTINCYWKLPNYIRTHTPSHSLSHPRKESAFFFSFLVQLHLSCVLIAYEPIFEYWLDIARI